jgi:hypothetical protein
MKKTLACLIAAGFAVAAPFAMAEDASGALTKQEAKDLKTQSAGEYKARKNVAEANHDLDKADCKTDTTSGSAERACKKEAKANEKAAKAEAKQIHETEKDAIKANTAK